jgi:hypothetical protein
VTLKLKSFIDCSNFHLETEKIPQTGYPQIATSEEACCTTSKEETQGSK